MVLYLNSLEKTLDREPLYMERQNDVRKDSNPGLLLLLLPWEGRLPIGPVAGNPNRQGHGQNPWPFFIFKKERDNI
jgi:hypothetical protein